MNQKKVLDVEQRKQLFQQRLGGNDFISANSLTQGNSLTDATEGPTHNFTTQNSIESQHLISHQHHNENIKPIPQVNDNSAIIMKFKTEIERLTKINEDQEKKYKDLSDFTVSVIKEHGDVISQIRQYEIEAKMRDSGFINPSFSSKVQWIDGAKILKLKKEINELNQIFEQIKLNPTTIDHKLRIENELNSRKEDLIKLEQERSEILKMISLGSSEFCPSQLLDDKRFVLLELIGRGGFGEVWKAYDFKETKYVAIKIQTQNPGWSQETVHNFAKHIAREIQILQNTDHPNVVKYIHFFYVGERVVALVMEYCEGGDLSKAIRRKTFDEKSAHFLLVQILHGLTALMKQHESRKESVIHYDLKPANILLDTMMIPKISDFGLSKITSDEHSIMLTSPGTGTIGYTAPETFTMGLLAKITSSADTWSLGIIYYEMLTGDEKFKVQISSPNTHLDIQNKKISQEGKDFLKRCLEKDPLIRPSIKDLIKDPYIESFNLNKRIKKQSTPTK